MLVLVVRCKKKLKKKLIVSAMTLSPLLPRTTWNFRNTSKMVSGKFADQKAEIQRNVQWHGIGILRKLRGNGHRRVRIVMCVVIAAVVSERSSYFMIHKTDVSKLFCICEHILDSGVAIWENALEQRSLHGWRLNAIQLVTTYISLLWYSCRIRVHWNFPIATTCVCCHLAYISSYMIFLLEKKVHIERLFILSV